MFQIVVLFWYQPCHRRPQFKCSPSEGPCCTETCVFETRAKQCRHESECNYESFCNGYDAYCPKPPPKPNKTECNGGTQVCWKGDCVGSICQKYDLEECFLTAKKGAKPDEMCEVACQLPDRIDTCRRTSEIDSMRNISGLKLRPGSPCNDFQGYCDVFQRCRAVDAEGPLARLKNLLLNQKTLMTIKQWVTVSDRPFPPFTPFPFSSNIFSHNLSSITLWKSVSHLIWWLPVLSFL